jgi:hypothetical protein
MMQGRTPSRLTGDLRFEIWNLKFEMIEIRKAGKEEQDSDCGHEVRFGCITRTAYRLL